MTSSDLPDDWQDLVAGYALGIIDPDEAKVVEQWLVDYPSVATELQALTSALGSLPYALPLQELPSDLKQRVMEAAIPAVSPPVPLASSEPMPPQVIGRPIWRWVIGGMGLGWAVTALAAAALFSENYRLRQAQRQNEALVASFVRPSSRVYTLVGTPDHPEARARLVIDATQGSVVIATENLPSLPPEQAYRLWAVATETPLYCGQFNPSAGVATVDWQIPDPACNSAIAHMLITTESATDPPVPRGPLVLKSQT